MEQQITLSSTIKPQMNTDKSTFTVTATVAVMFVLFIVLPLVVGALFGIYAGIQQIADTPAWMQRIDIAMLHTVLTAVCALPLIVYASKQRSIKAFCQFLALTPISKKQVALYALVTLLFYIITLLLQVALEVPEQAFITALANYPYPIVVALFVCVYAPIYEEVVFRGLLFKRFALSPVGNIGAMVITSLVFTLVHSQYDVTTLLFVFATGLYLGFVRLISKSTSMAIAMHFLLNFISLVLIFLT
ncbi:CPBP family intramembrane glutamic endopeptidase [Thalassotalea agarivorans]|uniref:CAAX protease self-immunity n=1 Tax=Thalassotalea agarivorans TaxID=349064 RepID=A0A1H9ZYC0_THASX|nr:type II CAAX endopeptidase family protein [Thalassotalea agarivorans]SES86785.1 CAAX protease self-immunity [Thalassotalea agarivorans]